MYAHTPYPVFADKYGNEVVCEGYAKAFKILCDRFNIPCTLVSGLAYTGSGSAGEAHMWNLVKMPDENGMGWMPPGMTRGMQDIIHISQQEQIHKGLTVHLQKSM